MKKTFLIVTIFLFIILSLIVVFNCTKGDKYTYQHVIQMIKEEQLLVNENGNVKLPEKMKYLSSTGECFVVEYNNKTAVYFYSYRVILESSKGFLVITDELNYKDYIDINKYSATMNFVNVKKVKDNLYSCSTD